MNHFTLDESAFWHSYHIVAAASRIGSSLRHPASGHFGANGKPTISGQ
jgi:hypothetical protein